MNLLYTLLIHPLESGMYVTLEGINALVDSYGWAIIALSVIVNIVLLPLYALAEKDTVHLRLALCGSVQP